MKTDKQQNTNSHPLCGVSWLCPLAVFVYEGWGGTSWRTRPPSALGGGGISGLVSQPHCQEIKRASHRQRARREPKRIRPLPAEPFSHLGQRYEARLWSVTKEQCAKSRFVSLPRRISIVGSRNGSWEEKELANTLNFTQDHCLCNIHSFRHKACDTHQQIQSLSGFQPYYGKIKQDYLIKQDSWIGFSAIINITKCSEVKVWFKWQTHIQQVTLLRATWQIRWMRKSTCKVNLFI